MRFTCTGGNNAVVSGIFFGAGSVIAPPDPTNTTSAAQFVKIDSTTQGSWKGIYGADGHLVLGDSAMYPAYVSLTPNAQSFWTWASSTSDVRGLQKFTAADRIEATWYSGTIFSLDLNLTDGQPHRVAFYALDFENAGRAQTVTILDAQTSAVLDTRSLSSFSGGQYLVWNLQGHVIVRFTRTGGNNAVTSGVFFN